MNRLTSEELQAIRVRAEKASEGPWDVDVPIDYRTNCKNKYEIVQSELFLSPIVAELNDVNDAEFIAHAREDVPKLVAEVERLREAIIEAIADIEAISPHEAKKTLREALNNHERLESGGK